MFPDSKKTAALIVAKLAGKKDEPEAELEMSDLEAAAQELIEAVHSKDSAGVVEALEAAFMACGSSHSAEEGVE
jgi:hypothetical protein